MRKKYFLLLILLITQNIFSQILFEEKASDLGINITGLFSDNLGGVSFFDYDQDGWDDLTFASKGNSTISFYKNNLGTFVEEFFITSTGHSKQVLWVDYDNDGDNDLFITKVDGYNQLFQNDGSFNFTDVTTVSGFPNTILKTYGASFGDYDNDGFLDLFLCNKDDDNIIPNQLYKNNGDGTFTDVSAIAGISPVGHLSFCSVFFDYDKDGYQDIYISNDRFINTNILYKNNGDGTFTDTSITSGTNIAANAMSTTIGDYNNDGWLDIYITNTSEGNHLMQNNTDGTFTDVAILTGTEFNSIGWGANFFDADNDMDLDLYVSSMINDSSSGLITTAFYENQNNNYSIPTNAGFNSDSYVSFCNAIGDVNNDGFQDFVVCNQSPDNQTLWRNNGGINNWIKISLEGVNSNKNGIGSWIEVSVNGNSIYRYTLCGESFLGQNSAVEIFGIGAAASIDYVKITWLSGVIDIINNVAPNQILNIIEGSTTLSNDEFTKNDFNIYPNPSSEFVTIKSIKNRDYSLEINDVSGRTILLREIEKSIYKFDTNTLKKGIYFFKIKVDKDIFIKKVVIK